MPRTSINPLNYQTRIVTPEGTPTPEFIRQWTQQIQTNTITEEQLAEAVAAAVAAALASAAAEAAANAAAAAVAALSATEVGGDGTDIEPAAAPLSDGNVVLGLTDTTVTPDTYGDATNVPQLTVDAKGRITGVTNVPISGGSGSTLDFEDEGTPVVTASVVNFTGAGVTVTDVAGVATVDIPGGSGGGGTWTLAASTTIAAPTATYDVTGLAGATDILVVMKDIAASGGSVLLTLASTDNGATFLNTSGDYVQVSNSGIIANVASMTSSASTGAVRGGVVTIAACDLTGPIKAFRTAAGNAGYIPAATNPINAIRVARPGANMTAGQIWVFVR